ncbi:5-hydroxytryptamine receptor 3A [Esox lucius]|uniref:Uncharacterized protein n=1 Tax=Esox lucius TaxID=8010 RepID=A0A3P8Z3Z7_ESOLU|nr:5-hydroxytryptamine receptor 3A [Esox lucius]
MIQVALLCLVFLLGTGSPDSVCSYQDVLNHLNLTKDNEVFTSTRPVLDHKNITNVKIEVYLYAILAMIEKSQTFIPFIWLKLTWNNELIRWNPEEFCGITKVSVPREMLWKPDIFIHEMTEKDDSPPTPYLNVDANGDVSMDEVMRMVVTCKMDIHKFPFDTQRCEISFSSAIYLENEMKFLPSDTSSNATKATCEVMQKTGEWEFLYINISDGKLLFKNREWDKIAYTITMKRRPLLYITNFVLPVLFFLFLDLASFLISDQRGEKLGFKVTVLLAISVMLLILKDILPSTSNKTPVIATYCIVVFAFLMLSLLETIFVTYLIERDSVVLEKDQENTPCRTRDQEGKRRDPSVFTAPEREAQNEPEEVIGGVQTQGHSRLLLLILEDLRSVEQTLALFATNNSEKKPGYWTKVARKVNLAYFTFYIISFILFIIFICKEWFEDTMYNGIGVSDVDFRCRIPPNA